MGLSARARARDASATSPGVVGTKATNDEKDDVVKFRTSATCPYAHRVWLAIRELDVEHEMTVENLENKSSAFKEQYAAHAVDAKANASVPIVAHKGATMMESALVLRYIAETFDGGKSGMTSILAKDPLAGYYGSLFAETFQTCVPLYFKMLRATNKEELDGATKEFIEGLKKANRALELGAKVRAGGSYACGERFTMYDILPMTFVPRFEIVLAHYRGFNLRMALKENGCDALEAWIAAVGARPSLVTTLKEVEKMRGTTVQQAFIEHFAKFVTWRA